MIDHSDIMSYEKRDAKRKSETKSYLYYYPAQLCYTNQSQVHNISLPEYILKLPKHKLDTYRTPSAHQICSKETDTQIFHHLSRSINVTRDIVDARNAHFNAPIDC